MTPLGHHTFNNACVCYNIEQSCCDGLLLINGKVTLQILITSIIISHLWYVEQVPVDDVTIVAFLVFLSCMIYRVHACVLIWSIYIAIYSCPSTFGRAVVSATQAS